MGNGSHKITRNPLQELNQTKSIDDHEIKTWLALGIKSKRKGVERKKMSFHFSTIYLPM